MYPKTVGNSASELLNFLWRNVLGGLMLKASGFQDSALTDYDGNIGSVRRDEISIPRAPNKGKNDFEWSITAQEINSYESSFHSIFPLDNENG